MKVTCTKKNLHNGLMTASRVIGAGTTLPVLNNILFKTEEGQLRLSSTNLEMAINTWVGGKIEEEGEITIPARIVNDYINNILADKITVYTKNQTLHIETDKTQTHIKGLASEEFPLIPKVGEKVYAKAEAADLAAVITEVAFAAAFSETQPEISGVLFSFEGKTLTLVATDRYRLAEGKVNLAAEIGEPRQIIIPVRTVNELRRILTSGSVDIFLGEGQACFKTPDTELVSRLIEGQYPDYQQILPRNFTTESQMNRQELIGSLKAASLFASESNNVELVLNPQNKQVVIRSQSAQVGDSEIRLDADFTGQKNSIIFNHRYLVECLNNLPDEKVVLKVIDASSPAALVAANRDNYLYVVMPIKI